nr:TniQ family protein [uncultured Rhodoferax sp.]
MTLLIRTPSPADTESLFGYVLRVAESNGYESPWQILSHAGISQRGMTSVTLPIKALASVLGKTPADLQHIAYSVRDAQGAIEYRLLGHSLGGSLVGGPLRRTNPAFCPQCVADHGYIDAFWDLRIAVACPIHRCAPITFCSACAQPLKVFRPGLLTCKCGASLATSTTSEVSPALVDLMAVIWAKVHRQSVNKAALWADLPLEGLMGMPLQTLTLKLLELGRFSLPSAGEGNDIGTLLQGAAETLSDWPRNFRALLHRIGGVEKTTGTGFRKRFEHFYAKFASNKKTNRDCGWLRAEFLRFGLEEWGESIVDNKLLVGKRANRRFVTKAELARHLGVSIVTVGNWAKKGHIPLKTRPTSSTSPRYIADLAAIDLKVPLQSDGPILVQRAAAAYLGIPVRVLSHLDKEGHFQKLHMLRHKNGYTTDDLDLFRKRLLELSPLVADLSLTPGATELVGLGHALRNSRFHSHASKAEFVVAYLNGRCISPGRTGDAVADIQFRKSDLLEYLTASRRQVADGAMTQRNVARILGTDEMAVNGLISQGLLVKVETRAGPRITPESVESFAGRHTSLAVLANEVGTTSALLLRRCLQSGFPVISITTRSGSRASFVDNSSVEVLRATWDDEPKDHAERKKWARRQKKAELLD